MKKNEHNQVYTGNQPGKAEFPIASLLPLGKENAIPTQELVKLAGCSTPRELQQHIALERKAGAIICSSTTGGYFIPANHAEIAEFCKSLENRTSNTFVAIRSAKQALKQPEGQQALENLVEDTDL
ncbi:hypothetical protein [Faecalicatena contorta]|uniref:hypothetical protein n=1 Tax=Faecalicatena contorta TaxID=39482 RepID=UPI00189A1968|nr:hypothetical protein [Faecalicatena contorta]